VIEYEKN